MAEPHDPRIGAILDGRYRVEERIASGGMGTVYRGERLQLGRPVAIKFLHAWVAAHPEMRERFNREAQAMSRLAHPSCVAVIDFGIADAVPYLVMEYVTGRTLRTALKEDGALPAATAITIATQLLAGLAHAHGEGIVHRDVKPDNIVLCEVTGLGEQARILDFGVAKLRDIQSDLTVGVAVGTPSYMAPEQTIGDAVDARTDVYSAGAVLFEMLTGRRLFEGASAHAILRMQREERPPRLADAAPQGKFSAGLEAAVARALAKRPADRFPSAAELAAALAATPEATRGPVKAPRAALPPAALAPTIALAGPRRRRPLLAAGALLAAAAAVGGAWLLLGHGASDGPAAEAVAAATVPAPKPGPRERRPAGEAVARRPPAQATPPAPPAPAAPPAPDGELDEARRLVASGRFAPAVDRLTKLRKRHPEDAELPYLLALLYLDKLWCEEGFEAARAALRLDPRYRQDAALIRGAIHSLVSDRHAGRASRFIREELGREAVPYLEEARRSRSKNVSRRAQQLLRALR